MKIGKYKDGGSKSKVWAYLFEVKKLFSVALLKFEDGGREVLHSHAFDCVSVILGPGYLEETFLDGTKRCHTPGRVLATRREDLHQVSSVGVTYALTLRGPWSGQWFEAREDGVYAMTNGRREYRLLEARTLREQSELVRALGLVAGVEDL